MKKHARSLFALLIALAMLLSALPLSAAEETLPQIALPNGDFETGNAEGWVLSGLPENPVRSNQWNEPNTSYTLNLWANDNDAVEIHASYAVWLTAGEYSFSFDISGQGVDSLLLWSVKAGDTVLAQAENSVVTVDWNVWNTVQTSSFTLTEPTEIVFDFGGTGPAGYWGDLDNLRLCGSGAIYTPPAEPTLIPLPNGDFETGNTEGWVLSGLPENPVRSNQWNEPNTSYTLNLWANDNDPVEIHASYAVSLTAGEYSFSFDISGQGIDSLLLWTVKAGDTVLAQAENSVVTVDWNVWNTVQTSSFTLTEPTEIVFDFGGTGPAGYWGDLDNLRLYGTGAIASGEGDFDHEPTIAVEKVNGVSSDDFMRGTDVSSYLSIVNSGAKFYDYEGNELDEQGFFNLLASAGFNYIRLRVWNDPFDAQGRGYGGGNCDVEAAKTMGLWATNAGMKVLIDFHYSDFWADPGKQKAPKAWSGYAAAQKAAAVQEFTYNSLKTLMDAGVDVGMVQVGNETTGSICGESSWANKAQIFSAGSAAIRQISTEYDHPILVAIHFTNPERSGNYASQALNLSNYNVDYDVFASSWYPYWHGTTSNLTTVLKQVADTYGKQVVVAETSWAWTLDDGDGHDNTVRRGNNDSGAAYPFSEQGQADELVAATKAVTAVGQAGIGVFYWENAWIPVQYAYDENGTLDNDILNANKALWEQYGSGWASSYAAEYDPNDAGRWYGGSAVDNQAMFDFGGKALDSLWTWEYMMSGTESAVEQEILSIEVPELEYELGATLSLPETLVVSYLVGGTANDPVTWDANDVAAVDMNAPGVYQIHGTVATQLGDREVILTVKVIRPNLLLNPGFEYSDLSMYTFTGNYDRSTDTPHDGSYCLHFYNANARSLDFSQTVTLEPGVYSFSFYAQGDAKGGTEQYAYVSLNGETLTENFALAGWNVWQHPELSFTVTETCSVTVGGHIAYGAGGWGTFDDLNLYLVEELAPAPDLTLRQSLRLDSEILISFTIAKAKLAAYEDFCIEVSKDDPDQGPVSVRFGEGQEFELEEDGDLYVATYAGITAKEMGTPYSAKVVIPGEEEDIEGPECAGCVRDVLESRLTSDSYTQEQHVLAAAMLNYGAAAQSFLGYQTDHLVNQELSAEGLAALEAYTAEEPEAEKINRSVTPEGQSRILYAAVLLENRVELCLSAKPKEANPGTLRFRIKDHETGDVLAVLDTVVNDGYYEAEFSDFGADQMRQEFDIVTLNEDGVEIGNVRTWSVEGFVNEVRQSGNPDRIALANAILNYGDAVSAYFNSLEE